MFLGWNSFRATRPLNEATTEAERFAQNMELSAAYSEYVAQEFRNLDPNDPKNLETRNAMARTALFTEGGSEVHDRAYAEFLKAPGLDEMSNEQFAELLGQARQRANDEMHAGWKAKVDKTGQPTTTDDQQGEIEETLI